MFLVYCDLASSQFISHKAIAGRAGIATALVQLMVAPPNYVCLFFLTVIFSGFVAEIRGRNTVVIMGEESGCFG